MGRSKEVKGSYLSPCPFCGNPDIYVGHISAFVIGTECKGCGAGGPPQNYPDFVEEGTNMDDVMLALMRDATRQWNERK